MPTVELISIGCMGMPVTIFTATNTVGTTTNYLDVGGASNTPARFYRVRLVP